MFGVEIGPVCGKTYRELSERSLCMAKEPLLKVAPPVRTEGGACLIVANGIV